MSADTAPLGAATLRIRTTLGLVAGRGAFRMALQAGNLLLLAVWGATEFGPYAAALGATVWAAYVGAGTEKSLLKQMPRLRALRPTVVRFGLTVAGLPLAVAVPAGAVALVVAPDWTGTLYLVATVWTSATGVMFATAALHRLADRPRHDAYAFGALAVAIGTSVLITWRFDLRPVVQLATIASAATVVAVTLVVTLPRPWLRRGPARRVVRPAILRATWMLGSYEMCSAAAASTLFAVLAASAPAEEASAFYLAIVTSAVVAAFLHYMLRLLAPRVSAALRGPVGGAQGRARARRILRRLIRGGTLTLVVLAVPLAVRTSDGFDPIMFGVVIVVEAAFYIVLTYATFLVENTDAKALADTSGSALIGAAAAVTVGAALVPLFGAAGAVAALAAGPVGQAAVLLAALRRRYPTEVDLEVASVRTG